MPSTIPIITEMLTPETQHQHHNQESDLKGRGAWEIGGTRWWVLRRAWIAWSTGCGAKTMNTVMLKRNKKLKKKKVVFENK